ncbi:MAG: globin domain-containing protein [Pseudomonadales bacterium]
MIVDCVGSVFGAMFAPDQTRCGTDLRLPTCVAARCNWPDLTLALLEGANLDGACFECAAVDTEFAQRHPDQHTVAGGHLSRRQVELVRSTFAQLERCGSTAIDLFYQNLFAARPDLAAMFSGSRRRQSQKFLVSLKVIVTALGQPERSIEVLEQLGRRHAGYGVRREHYDLAGGVLMVTLAQYFGAAFADETAEAWKRAFDLIAGVMRGSDVQPQAR